MQTRTTRSSRPLQPTNINKPFRSPIIKKDIVPAEETKQPQKQRGLLDEIQDSDDEASQRLPSLSPPREYPEISFEDNLESQIVDPPSKLDTVDDIEDDVAEEENQAAPFKSLSRSNTGSKKGKFRSKMDRQKTENMERKEAERKVEKKDTEAKPRGLLGYVDKYDPVKLAKESPKKTPKKDILGLARYDNVIKKNGLDPKLLALLNDTLDKDGSGSDSDSDDSTSSKKRKRSPSGTPEEPIDLDDETTPKKTKSKKSKKVKNKYTCFMCNEEVSKELYESYMPDLLKTMSVKRKLHKSHKQAAAHAKKKRLGIPDIDWDILEDRCKEYFSYLGDIMAGKAKSHYRNVSEQFFKAKHQNGQSRTEAVFQKGNWEKEYPGYYGPRGRDIIADAISGSKLIMAALKKLKQAKDVTLVNSGEGVYIQSILIPELAIRLIMDDFKMGEDDIEKGRKLMLDTIDVGLALNDDNDDYSEVNDGMDWWWKEQEEKRQQEEDTEPSMSQQSSIYIEADE
ncbi:hypothetical protein TWF694_000903 [Orbilia ellipsospora]|uniref:Restriction of telomere capping protein 4 n=1 Tax=Orbilia ellipsospora TaxID=2528407 RepID=A0AAV9XQU6_9PEZI